MNGFIQVSTTTQTRREAEAIARYLVDEKLAACVQITGEINSTYLWKGNIETAPEYLCLIKTRKDLFARVEAAVKRLHSYETPEIIALPVVDGSSDYLRWLDESIVKSM